MRVNGNIAPAPILIEPYPAREGYVEIRLRENIKEIATPENAAQMFEYDEYTFHVVSREGLQQKIESNISDWLATGRALEISENASALRDATDQNSELLDAMAAMVEELYESDLDMIGGE